ncbi:MAG: TolC family protein, partial [Bacteroidetes bacterium]|nr:TolC family protein [Bacteroidota bacterium]
KNKVLGAYTDAKASSKQYDAAKKSVEAMKRSFKYTEEKFKLGVVNSLEYTTAKNNLAANESLLIRAKYNYLFKLKILDFYQGKPISIQ